MMRSCSLSLISLPARSPRARHRCSPWPMRAPSLTIIYLIPLPQPYTSRGGDFVFSWPVFSVVSSLASFFLLLWRFLKVFRGSLSPPPPLLPHALPPSALPLLTVCPYIPRFFGIVSSVCGCGGGARLNCIISLPLLLLVLALVKHTDFSPRARASRYLSHPPSLPVSLLGSPMHMRDCCLACIPVRCILDLLCTEERRKAATGARGQRRVGRASRFMQLYARWSVPSHFFAFRRPVPCRSLLSSLSFVYLL